MGHRVGHRAGHRVGHGPGHGLGPGFVNTPNDSYMYMISNETNKQTIDGWKITGAATDQSLQLSRFDDQSHHDKTDLSEPRPER